MRVEKRSTTIPLVRAVAWIVGSVLVISGSGHFFIQHALRKHRQMVQDPRFRITRILQTGPQKEALSTLCLAEIMELSTDRPTSIASFNVSKAKRRLAACPVIENARIELEKPNTLFIDYSTRQPIAWLYDYVDIGLDEKGVCFPVPPFFSSKNLPEIYLGLFEKSPAPTPLHWNRPLEDERLKLALNILNIFSTKEYNGLFSLRRIDVSSAFAASCGKRQIVLYVEEGCKKVVGQKEIYAIQPIYLRLSVKNISQELGNYLSMRQKLWDMVDWGQANAGEIVLPQRVIDLRVDGLAFIQ